MAYADTTVLSNIPNAVVGYLTDDLGNVTEVTGYAVESETRPWQEALLIRQ